MVKSTFHPKGCDVNLLRLRSGAQRRMQWDARVFDQGRLAREKGRNASRGGPERHRPRSTPWNSRVGCVGFCNPPCVSDVTRILNAIQRGECQTTDELLPLVYDELRRMAAARLQQEVPGQTIQATELVHEAYLRLIGADVQNWEGRRHFFGAAAEAMRRILIERARRKQRLRHGGQLERVELEEIELPALTPSEDLLAIDEALESLAGVDAQAAELVKLRFFVGLTHGQAAEILGVSRRTADNIWAFARAWLYRAIRQEKA